VDVMVEELADWDVGDMGVPLPVVPGADEVPATEPPPPSDCIFN
jgi:hypothetical protein